MISIALLPYPQISEAEKTITKLKTKCISVATIKFSLSEYINIVKIPITADAVIHTAKSFVLQISPAIKYRHMVVIIEPIPAPVIPK